MRNQRYRRVIGVTAFVLLVLTVCASLFIFFRPLSIPATQRTVFRAETSGPTRCDWKRLRRRLDDWAQRSGTAWQGKRSNSENQGRMVLAASITYAQAEGVQGAQAQFVYRQRESGFEMELMLSHSEGRREVVDILDVPSLWIDLEGACR